MCFSPGSPSSQPREGVGEQWWLPTLTGFPGEYGLQSSDVTARVPAGPSPRKSMMFNKRGAEYTIEISILEAVGRAHFRFRG